MKQSTVSNSNARTTTTTTQTALYEHSAKPSWGLALLAWERDGKRGYQFADGRLRIFKRGFYHLLAPVDRPRDETELALRELNLKLGRDRASKRLAADRPSVPLAGQIDYFKGLFPKGLQGVAWAKKHRGVDANKRLKRHRNAAVADAAVFADRAALEAKVAAGEATAVVERLVELVSDTDLVTKTQLRGFARVSEPLAAQLVSALVNLLWGEDDLGKRFNRWVGALGRALGSKPRWQLATALPALARPSDYVCVKRTTFVRQAAWMAPNLDIATAPSGAVYARLIEMSQLLSDKLAASGLVARDLLDVHDFINATLRPKAALAISAATQSADAAPAADSEPVEQAEAA